METLEYFVIVYCSSLKIASGENMVRFVVIAVTAHGSIKLCTRLAICYFLVVCFWLYLPKFPLPRRHNKGFDVLNYQRLDCWPNRLFSSRSKKLQSFATTAFVKGIHWWLSTDGFSSQGPVTMTMYPFDDITVFFRFVSRAMGQL